MLEFESGRNFMTGKTLEDMNTRNTNKDLKQDPTDFTRHSTQSGAKPPSEIRTSLSPRQLADRSRSPRLKPERDPMMGNLHEFVDANIATLHVLMQEKRKLHMIIEEARLALSAASLEKDNYTR